MSLPALTPGLLAGCFYHVQPFEKDASKRHSGKKRRVRRERRDVAIKLGFGQFFREVVIAETERNLEGDKSLFY